MDPEKILETMVRVYRDEGYYNAEDITEKMKVLILAIAHAIDNYKLAESMVKALVIIGNEHFKAGLQKGKMEGRQFSVSPN